MINMNASLNTQLSNKINLAGARAKHILLSEAMLKHYKLAYWYEQGYLASEPQIFTCFQLDTEDLLDNLSLAGYTICSRHSIQQLLDAPKLIVRLASVHPEHAQAVEAIQLGSSNTALFIIPAQKELIK